MNIDKNKILIGVAVLAILITGSLLLAGSNPMLKGWMAKLNIFPDSQNAIAQKAVNYINQSGLAGQGQTVTLDKVSQESGLIKVTIKVGNDSFDSYVTKDGKLLFPRAFLIPVDTDSSGAATGSAGTIAKQTLAKAEKPSLQAFVVSACPFGLQMQRAMADAVSKVPSLADYITVRYIGSANGNDISAMHDAAPNGIEAKENVRQICIREEQPAKYWSYVACYMKKAAGALPNTMPIGDTEGCLASTGVDIAKVNSCMSSSSRGIAYAKKDFELANKYNATGSPTLIANDARVSEDGFGGRSSDAIKNIVCEASTNPPDFCSEKLDTTQAATSFSLTYASATAASSSNAPMCAPAQ